MNVALLAQLAKRPVGQTQDNPMVNLRGMINDELKRKALELYGRDVTPIKGISDIETIPISEPFGDIETIPISKPFTDKETIPISKPLTDIESIPISEPLSDKLDGEVSEVEERLRRMVATPNMKETPVESVKPGGGAEMLSQTSSDASKYKTAEEFVKANLGKPDTFHINGKVYDLKSADQYIKTNDVQPIEVPKDLYSQRRIAEIGSVGVLKDGREPDLSHPIIMASSIRSDGSTGYQIIDGWNRAEKALNEGKPLMGYSVPSEATKLTDIWNKAQTDLAKRKSK